MGDQEQKLVEWIERTLGGKVTAITRQNRWRHAWFVELTRPTGVEQLYVRGDRTYENIYTLQHEYAVHELLEKHGVLVPHLYGMCPDPRAMVMARAPGRFNLATAADDAERRAVMDQYMDQLAKIHAIDPAEAEAVGVYRPVGSDAIGGVLFDKYANDYRDAKQGPEPLMEFLIGWARRNQPKRRRQARLIVADSGQFLFDEGRLTAVLDLEMAHLSDPVIDLAALQLRDSSEPFGDVGRALRRYIETTGEPIDAEAFDFYSIQWTMGTPLFLAKFLAKPVPASSFINIAWYFGMARILLEAVARHLGMDLPPRPVPQRRQARFGRIGELLSADIRGIRAADDFAAYERDTIADMAAYLQRAAEMGPAFEEQDMADVEALLGAKFKDWRDADAAFETFVREAGPELDGALTVLFYRQIQRRLVILEGDKPAADFRLKSFAELMGEAPSPR